MVDNSWINDDRVKSKGESVNRMQRTKVLITVAILLTGALIAIVVHSLGSDATMYQAEGILIDAGDHQTFWTDVSYTEYGDDPSVLLDAACSLKGYTKTMDGDTITSITIEDVTYSSTPEKTWDLWYVKKGDFDFTKSETTDINASDYTVVAWALMGAGETPSVAVDATASCIYGYSQPSTIVTLSPVCTELIGSMKATSAVIGVDSVKAGQGILGFHSGEIAIKKWMLKINKPKG